MSVYAHISFGGPSLHEALRTLSDQLASGLSNVSAFSADPDDRMVLIDRIYDETITDRFMGKLYLEESNDND